MREESAAAPDSTAVRVVLWRALHLELDTPPPVFRDEVGLRLAAPGLGWRDRSDMGPLTRPFLASIVPRVPMLGASVVDPSPSKANRPQPAFRAAS